MTSRENLFRRINNSLLDMQAATSQTFEQHFLTFARLIADPSLQALNQQLVIGLDLDQFLSDSLATQGSMAGTARLTWPVDAHETLGLKWLLIQELAREPQRLLSFASTFYTVGRNWTRELHSLTRQLLIPFGRDYKEFVVSSEEVSGETSDTAMPDGSAQHTAQYVTYNISGSNARVNNHSVDNSVNKLIVNQAASNQIQVLRDEIQRASLTAEQKIEATEVVDEVERQVGSGHPKKSVVSALLSSLPAIQSITTIAKTISDLLLANFHK